MSCYDYRHDAAVYYDKFTNAPPGDIAFYRDHLPNAGARVLELGCGTGRVLTPLADHCAYIHGLDLSPGMLRFAQEKLDAADIGPERAVVEQADISDFDLTETQPPFDLVTAPFRVMQNLETDEQIEGMMQCIAKHMAPGGRAILNTFKPRGGPEELRKFWAARTEGTVTWEQRDGNDTVRLYDDCTRFREDGTAVYPRLIYRHYNAQGKQIDEAVLDIVMRVWQPDELIALVESNGFTITEKHGGYQGEPWCEGSELVVVFGNP